MMVPSPCSMVLSLKTAEGMAIRHMKAKARSSPAGAYPVFFKQLSPGRMPGA